MRILSFFRLMSSEDEEEMNNEQVPEVLAILPFVILYFSLA
jgi:hypothetical protein